MRSLLALLLVTMLARPVWAGPDEPKPTLSDEPTSDAPAATVNAPAPAPATTTTTTTTTTTEPAPAPPTATPVAIGPHEVEEIEPNPPRKWAYIFGGAAAGCFLLGGILGGVAIVRANEQAGDPAHPPLYNSDLQGRAGEGKALAISAYAFFAAGAALAIVDVVLWFETLRKPKVIKRTVATSRFFPLGVRF